LPNGGRSLGIVLIGAQQTASEVERRVISNSSIRVVGRLDPAEAARPEYGSCRARTRSGQTIAKPGTMFVMQPEIPIPLVVEFPFPAWATRPDEVDPASLHTRSSSNGNGNGNGNGAHAPADPFALFPGSRA